MPRVGKTGNGARARRAHGVDGVRGFRHARTIAALALLAIVAALLAVTFSTARASELRKALNESAHAPLSTEEAALLSDALGPATLIPPFLAVALALLTREVLSSLLLGALSGYTILYLSSGPGGGVLQGVATVGDTTVRSLLDVLSNPYHNAIIALCLIIGGMVGVMRASGGFAALANSVIRRVKSPRSAQLVAGLLGVTIFFDDYANALIVGPVMRPVTDRMGVSRERLAYIVDSTAAPVAGMAVVSSWISAQLAAIEGGLTLAGAQASAYVTFLGSLPYCFYNMLCLVFLFASTLMRREYGPMLGAEVRARGGKPVPPSFTGSGRTMESHDAGGNAIPGSRLWIAVIPVQLFTVLTLAGFYITGLFAARAAGLLPAGVPLWRLETILTVFGAADTLTVLVESALVTSLAAIGLGVALKAFSFRKAVDAWLSGASELLITGVMLGLAWTLTAAVERLGAARYLVETLTPALPYWLMPALIFFSCCLVSFAAGSYGCMLIVMPMAIPVAYSLTALHPVIADANAYVCMCVAAVLSGAIFGDHCSPITDTTILSSAGAGCASTAHVKTQLPYALTIAVVAGLFGMLLTGCGVSSLVALPLSAGVCIAIIGMFGRDPDRIAAIRGKLSTENNP